MVMAVELGFGKEGMGREENTRGGFSVDGSYVWLLPCMCGC